MPFFRFLKQNFPFNWKTERRKEKMKKKLLAVMGTLGLAMMSLFVSPISSSAATEATTSTATVGQADIESYIAGKTAKGQLFYEYNLLVNRCYNWERDSYQNWYENDEQGEIKSTIEVGDVLLPTTYTFQKGNAYFIDLAKPELSSYANGKFTNYDLENGFIFRQLYSLSNTQITKPFGCDTNAYYEDEYTYTWDNPEVCAAIDSAWRNKLDAVYFGLSFPMGSRQAVFQADGDVLLIVPEENFTITLDVSKATSYPGLSLYINHAKILEQDYQAPLFENAVNLAVNVDNQPSLESILANIKAIDETDGLVPVELVSTTYVPGVMEIGTYDVTISASDSASNTNQYTFYVNRFDNTAPTIAGQDSYTLNYDNDFTIEDIIENLEVTDNVDSNLTLSVVSDTFTQNKNKLGTYQVVFNTKDLSNNTSANKTVTLHVVNEGYSIISAPKTITVSTSKKLTLEEFKSRIVVTDGYDGEITNYSISGFDEYTTTWTAKGNDEILVSYTNSGNHLTEASITIIKVDDQMPNFFFNSGYFVLLAKKETFTMAQFRTTAAKVLKVTEADIVEVKGEWNTEEAGSYSVMLTMVDGTTEDFTIHVGQMNKYEVTYTWTPKQFFSFNMDNWNMFEAWPSWSICAWLSWVGIGIVGLIVAAGLFKLGRKAIKKALR